MTLVELHARLANTALFFCIIMGLWGTWRFLRKHGMDGSYWGAAVIAEVLILVQGALGAYLWIIGLRPARNIHVLYGIVAALAIPLIFFYTKGREERPEMLMYAVGFLILAGLLLRAMSTA
jgi:CDP-diglyceride synthetase